MVTCAVLCAISLATLHSHMLDPWPGVSKPHRGTLCHTIALHEQAEVGQDAAILLGKPLSLSPSQ